MLYIAHRGYPNKLYNDNSFEAFQNAINNNFNILEIDIQLCKSGEIVIYHDIYLNDKLIKNLDFKDLKYNINTLELFFKKFYKHNMKILFDIKGHHEGISKKLIYILNEYKVNYHNIFLSSFNKIIIDELISFKKIHNFKLGLISDNNFYYDEIKYQLDKVDFISINFEMFLVCDKYLLGECKKRNKKIFVWTIKDDNQIALLKDCEVDGIISDIKLN